MNPLFDQVIDDIINEKRELSQVMHYPKDEIEQEVSTYLLSLYESEASQHLLHPDDDFEDIESRVFDTLVADWA